MQAQVLIGRPYFSKNWQPFEKKGSRTGKRRVSRPPVNRGPTTSWELQLTGWCKWQVVGQRGRLRRLIFSGGCLSSWSWWQIKLSQWKIPATFCSNFLLPSFVSSTYLLNREFQFTTLFMNNYLCTLTEKNCFEINCDVPRRCDVGGCGPVIVSWCILLNVSRGTVMYHLVWCRWLWLSHRKRVILYLNWRN